MQKLRRFVAIALAAALAPVSFAQTPAAAPAVAPPTCVKPEFPGRVAVDAKLRRWSKEFKDYIDCLKAYVGERNAVIDANSKAAKAAVDEFNASVTEYNETVTSMKQ